MRTDAQLIREARDDPNAFAELYLRHSQPLVPVVASAGPRAGSRGADRGGVRPGGARTHALSRRDAARESDRGEYAAPDLQLDPTKWAILGSGGVDNGRGQYVHAQDKATGAHSSFSVEHDAALGRYDAFLLYEQLRDAENATAPEPAPVEPGALCTAAQLTRAESGDARLVVLARCRTERHEERSGRGRARRIHGLACRGLEYGGE